MRALAAVALVGATAWGVQSPAGRSAVDADAQAMARVHHLHFVVDDPIRALQTRADRLGGTIVPLPGLGAGVRLGNRYLLFDRSADAGAFAAGPDRIQSAFDASVRWLSAHGVSTPPNEFATLAPVIASEVLPIDHLGFVATDYANTVEAVVARGTRPLSRTADAAMFALADGTRVEIVRDSEAPDAYWCPMHPAVRSGATGTCPLCAMALVVIRPPSIGEYRMDVVVVPGAERRGLGGLRLVLREPVNGRPVSDFLTVHEKPLHLFIVSRDLEYFAHVHPDAAGDDSFRLTHAAPPGEYVIIADFLPKSGTAQMVHRAIATPGRTGPSAPIVPMTLRSDIPGDGTAASGNATWGSAEKTVDGVRVRLDGADLIAGRIGVLRFHLFDARDGTPIADLEPYLGAPGHMLMTNTTLTDSVHGHPEETSTHTSVITFKPLMPPTGAVKLWLQFQRKGAVTTVPFVIDVQEP